MDLDHFTLLKMWLLISPFMAFGSLKLILRGAAAGAPPGAAEA